MAKKFAAILGLHNIFNLQSISIDGQTQYQYNINGEFLDNSVDKNTVCFVTADGIDANQYLADHLIEENDRFIIVQNDVYSLYGSLENPIDIQENTWRPLYIKGVPVTSIDYNGDTPKEPYNLNFEDSDYLSVNSSYNETLEQLSIKYNFDIDSVTEYVKSQIDIPEPPDLDDITEYVQEHIVFPDPEIDLDELADSLVDKVAEKIVIPTPEPPEEPIYPNDGILNFETSQETVHTDNPVDYDEEDNPITDIEIPQNTVNIEGSFSANSASDSTVTIRYKGTADRVDWFVENETRNQSDENNSKSKKFVYIECLQEYFDYSSNYPYLILKESAKDIISEDSIVFITCGQIISGEGANRKILTDAEVFSNPEYYPGARFIWTHNMMFSTNTWIPIFTRETENSQLNGITPPIGSNHHGAKLIFQGKGGIIVDNTQNEDDFERIITIDGSGITRGEGGGSSIDLPLDTTQVVIAQDIPIQGTELAQGVLRDGNFSDWDNKVKKGATLQEVLRRLLYKEIAEFWNEPNPSFTYTFTMVGPDVTGKNADTDETITNGASLPVGTEIILTVNKHNQSKFTRNQKVSISGFTSGGYQIDNGSINSGSSYTKTYNSSSNPALPDPELYDNTVSNEDEQSAINGNFEVISKSGNQITLKVKSGSDNTITFHNQGKQSSAPITEYTVYSISNKGNKSPDSQYKVVVNTDKWTELPKTVNKNTTFTIHPVLPFFVGYIGNYSDSIKSTEEIDPTKNYYEDYIDGNIANPTVDSDAEYAFLKLTNKPTTANPVKIVPSDTFKDEDGLVPTALDMPCQLIVFAPKARFSSGTSSSDNWITVLNAQGQSWHDVDSIYYTYKKGETTINGDQYFVWCIAPKRTSSKLQRATELWISFNNFT